MNATISPEMICHTPHQATTINIPPVTIPAGNIFGLKSKASPSPEFCIPVSIIRLRRSAGDRLNISPTPYPSVKATPLCTSTMIKI